MGNLLSKCIKVEFTIGLEKVTMAYAVIATMKATVSQFSWLQENQ